MKVTGVPSVVHPQGALVRSQIQEDQTGAGHPLVRFRAVRLHLDLGLVLLALKLGLRLHFALGASDLKLLLQLFEDACLLRGPLALQLVFRQCKLSAAVVGEAQQGELRLMSFGLDSEAILQPVPCLIENRVSLLTLKLPAPNSAASRKERRGHPG